MIFQETKLKGAFIIDIEKIEDERGFFAEGWKQNVAEQHGIQAEFTRTNISNNAKKGTLRGMHSQKAPYAEAKLVRCIQGSIVDAIVDIRPDSPTYLQWISVELSAQNYRMLYVPCGFLHGFQTLEDDTTVFYQVAGIYHPEAEQGARYDDPAFNIQWPQATERTLSPKDKSWPDFII
jgi:dTDP-4-dehydrorhamnose 3,5-epimerase